ncbi:MAG: G1 family glutamic endopeptidase [Acidimicrobiales bacterium]
MSRCAAGLIVAGATLVAGSFLASPAGASTRVPGLYACAPSRTCDYGPINYSFPNYRSVCSLEDCSFVSAANWEQIVEAVTPSATLLAADFGAAGEIFGGGLVMSDLWSYWTAQGIDGVYLTGTSRLSRSKVRIESAILAQGALLLEDVTTHSSYLGTAKYGAGTAIMVADGYTPKGPLVVYQGRTIQMTWAQWTAQVRLVWGLSVSTTPPPPPPNSPTATLSLSQSDVPASGATVTLTFSSQNATACTLSSAPSLWSNGSVSVPCVGTYPVNVVASSIVQRWTLTFTANNAAGQSATATQSLTQGAPPPPADNPSANWSGYVVPSSSALITDAQGNFTVPTLNCVDTPNANMSVWVGLGGQQWATGGSSGSLLQTGVEADCVGGVQESYGWWELVPATPNYAQSFTGFPVSPGDSMQASVFQGSSGAWETLLSDVNTGLSALMVTGESWGVGPTSTGTITFTPQGSATAISYDGAYTAEWIVEVPTGASSQGTETLADFVSVTFTSLRASFSSWSLTPDETWAIVQNGMTLATPTDTVTDGFTVVYTGP